MFPTNKTLQAFDSIIGTWNTVGTHGMVPNTTLHGRTIFDWHESGAFVIMRTSIEENVGIPKGVALIGSDDTLGQITMIYYDERGVSRNYQVSFEGNTLIWWRKAPEFSQRNTLVISEDGKMITGIGEISEDGSTWKQDLNLTYSKV